MFNQRFITTFAGSLDSKSRVCIPASWRDVLKKQDTDGVYACPSLDGDCLIGFGEELMQAEIKRIEALDPIYSTDYETFSHLVSYSHRLTIDDNGRVRLPDELIAACGLADRVVFVGMGLKFEIWNPDTFAPVKERRLANARAERAARSALEAAARAALLAQIPAAPVPPAAEEAP